MERDEAGTYVRLLKERQDLFEPEIARHHGRIFKLMGDGLLAEFGSVVDAVECAGSIQRGLAERNAHVAEPERIKVRIGINLGEVIVEGDDRYGDGVNIATRLEQLAEPGGICVSGKVAKEVEKKLAFGFEPMGEQKVKNIAEPIEAFRIRLDGVSKASSRPKRVSWLRVAAVALALVLATGLAGGAAYWLSGPAPEAIVAVPSTADGKPSLVVLPFANLSDDKDQGYLADGITEDLTTELARVPGLFVISRNAAYTYKGKPTLPAQIAKELGVHYLLEGSTRRVADEMRINAQLIDTGTGGHIWAKRFDGAWSEVFALQDRVVADVAATLKLKLAPDSPEAVGGTSNVAAYDAYLRGLKLQNSASPDDWAKAVAHFEKALAIDPAFGSAAAKLAWMYYSAQGVRSKQAALGITEEEAWTRRKASFEQAAAHPSSTYYQLLAEDLLYQQRSDEAVTAAQRGIALDPSDPWGYEEMSLALIFNGRPEDARAYLNATLRVDPNWTLWRYVIAGLIEFSLGRFETAAAQLENIESRAVPASFWDFWARYNGLRLLVATYGNLGRDTSSLKDKVATYQADAEDKEFTVALLLVEFPFKNPTDTERLIKGLRKAGVPDLPTAAMAKLKSRLNGAELRALLFGHVIEGRLLETGETYRRETTPDGIGNVTIGTRHERFFTTVEGDFVCSASHTSPRGCGAIVRNPEGSPEQRNEYFFLRQDNSFAFSVVN
jgi:TolB-like protein